MTKEEEKQPGETMSDLRERIAEITERNERQAREIRGSDPRFVSTEVRAMVEDVGYLLALLKQEPVGWQVRFPCDRDPRWENVAGPEEEVDQYGKMWCGHDGKYDKRAIYAAPVVPEGEVVEGWAGLMRVRVNSEPSEPVDGCWEFVAEKQADPYTREEYRRAILIFPEDK